MTRAPLYAALYAEAQALKTAGTVRTVSDILLPFDQVPSEDRPALFQTVTRETPHYVSAIATPHAWTIEATWWVYVSRPDGTPPQAVLGPVLDAIEARLTPLHGIVTLGGLVEKVQLGTIETSEGTLGNDEIAIVPVRLTVAA